MQSFGASDVIVGRAFYVYSLRVSREELGQGGGYTRIYLLGERRGDATEKAIIELG